MENVKKEVVEVVTVMDFLRKYKKEVMVSTAVAVGIQLLRSEAYRKGYAKGLTEGYLVAATDVMKVLKNDVVENEKVNKTIDNNIIKQYLNHQNRG